MSHAAPPTSPPPGATDPAAALATAGLAIAAAAPVPAGPPEPRVAPGATSSFYYDDGHLWRDLAVADLPAALRQCGAPVATAASAPGAAAPPAPERDGKDGKDSRDGAKDGKTTEAQLWVDVDSADPAQHALLGEVFGFHPLAIEDTLSAESRVRVEQYDGYLFAIVRAVAFQEATPDPYDLRTQNLYFFIGRNYVVTVHAGPAPAVQAVRAHVERNARLLARGAARVAHLVMDVAVDAYFPVLQGIDEFFDLIEPRVFSEFDERALQDIFQLKRLVLTLRRYLAPQREVFSVLANRPTELIAPKAQRYFADVHDHVLRVYDQLDSARDLLGSTLDSYLTQVSNRTAQASKSLAVVATLSTPFVVVAGMWGMNFERVPFATARYGFEYMVAAQLAIGLLLVLLLRWRKVL